ncbi:MAG: urate hydroxylase PuuD [Alphaproteobacteria bacterium]|nr:urate hydroxylase PuuD [Alphaproteobacteria bacterium]
MADLLSNLNRTLIAGFLLSLVVFFIMVVVWTGGPTALGATLMSERFWSFIMRWLHVVSGVVWIGLLYYFNLVQMTQMPRIPDEQKPAVSKFIAPEALWWFRWGAMSTIVTGIILAALNGYLLQAITLGAIERFSSPSTILIGIGMWLGTIMWFNVWFIIWPNQQKAMNIDNRYPDLQKEDKALAARTAMLFSRTNMMLSVPMLFAMTGGGINANFVAG